MPDAKSTLQTDERFEEWVKANCPFSYQTACRYVRLADNWGTFTEHQRATEGISNLLDLVKGKPRTRKKGKRKGGGNRVKVTAARLREIVGQCGITGKVDEFVKLLGVRVVDDKKNGQTEKKAA